ncbi:MAG: rod shape-determining protein MreD [Chlorobiaceae bacterium]|nr:rod shape-determining protein MreD [Chlorobiaceae bacterium]
MKKYFIYTLAMLTLALVQHFIVSRLLIFHASPDIMAIFIAFVSMSIGQRTGTTFGFAAGLIGGLLTGNVGLSALIGTVEGFSAGFFHVPEESHATSVKKRRMFYAASTVALILGNMLLATLHNPLSLPAYVRLPQMVGLGTIMSMVLGTLMYNFVLKKLLKD